MPSMKKWKLIFFLVISYLLVLANTTDPGPTTSETKSEIERKFEVETVTHFREKIRGNEEKLEAHYFNSLSERDRKDLCIEAKNFASFDGMGKHVDVHKPTECSITHNNGSEDTSAIVLKCETIPVSYLWIQDANNITIFIRTNEYDKDTISFNVSMLESDAQENSEEIAEDDDLEGLLQETRLQLCIAAKKRVEEMPKPVLRNPEIPKPKVFLMKFEKTEEPEKRIAIDCLSTPAMYAFFGKTEDEIEVALVKNAK